MYAVEITVVGNPSVLLTRRAVGKTTNR